MREYETVFVLDVGLEGDAAEGEIDRVVKLIEEKDGKIHDVQKWGRRRLAYPIEKKTDGIYTLVRYDGHGDLLNELDRRFTLNEALIRHMTVVVDHPDARKVGPGVEPAEPRGRDRDRDRDRGPRDDRRGPRREAPTRSDFESKPAEEPVEEPAEKPAEAQAEAAATESAEGAPKENA